MRPELFHIFGIAFGSYRVCLTIAFLVCTFMAVREVERRNEPFSVSPVGGIWGFFGALIGARAFFILQYGSVWELWQAVLIWQGGLVYYGGLLGGTAAMIAYLLWNRVPVLAAFDVFAPFLALGQAITRIGCFLNGCCYGIPTHLPWGVRFPSGSVAHEDHAVQGLIDASAPCTVPLHPAQLYMAAGLVAIFLALKWTLARKTRAGQVVCAYLISYGVLRFVVEFMRGDNEALLLRMTLYQWISAVLVIAGIAGLALARTRRATVSSPQAPSE